MKYEKETGRSAIFSDTVTLFVCDTCGHESQSDAIVVEHGYGSLLDGERQDFCSIGCMVAFGQKHLIDYPE